MPFLSACEVAGVSSRHTTQEARVRVTMAGRRLYGVLLTLLVLAASQVQAFRPAGFLPAGRSKAAASRLVAGADRLQARFAGHFGSSDSISISSANEDRSSRRRRLLTQAWATSTDCGPDRSNWGPAHLVEERDACGVGFIADITGKAKPGLVLDKALVALGCMEHRGACSADQVRFEDEDGRGGEVCLVSLSACGRLPFALLHARHHTTYAS